MENSMIDPPEDRYDPYEDEEDPDDEVLVDTERYVYAKMPPWNLCMGTEDEIGF
jgi:hypothetical protein